MTMDPPLVLPPPDFVMICLHDAAGTGAHPRSHYRRAAQRRLPAPRRTRTGSQRQNAPAHDLAFGPARQRADFTGTDGRMGAQAQANRTAPARSRGLHARNRENRSDVQTPELQSLIRTSLAVFRLTKT